MSMQTLLLSIAVLLGLFGLSVYSVMPEIPQDEIACTAEAKICPDGSAVGRTEPNCEFTQCPVPNKDNDTILHYDSGVRGVVLLGPTCPVMRNPPDPDCNDKPYQTDITIAHENSPLQVFVSTQSDSKGLFEVDLPPGAYIIYARGEMTLPSCSQTPAMVETGNYTQVTVACDTGIR